jgi:hypothetical protein
MDVDDAAKSSENGLLHGTLDESISTILSSENI